MKTVTTYVVCSSDGRELTEPTRNFSEAKVALIRLRDQNPAEFYHIEDRSEEAIKGCPLHPESMSAKSSRRRKSDEQ